MKNSSAHKFRYLVWAFVFVVGAIMSVIGWRLDYDVDGLPIASSIPNAKDNHGTNVSSNTNQAANICPTPREESAESPNNSAAYDEARLRAAINEHLVKHPLHRFNGYQPYEVGTGPNLRIEGEWALFNLLSTPDYEYREQFGTSPIVVLGIAHKQNNRWSVFIESTQEYEDILNCVPPSFQWLKQRNEIN